LASTEESKTAMTTRQHHVVFWLVALTLLAVVLSLFRDILLPFVSGIVIAYFVNPVADALQRCGLGRGIAAAIIVGLAGAVVVTALVLLVPALAVQLKQIAVTLPTELDRLRTTLEATARDRLGGHYPTLQAAIERALADLQAGWAASAGQVISAVFSRGIAVVNVLSLLLITPLVVFYLLLDWHSMLAKIESWLPRDHVATIKSLATDIDQAVAAFIRGQGTICLLLGLFYALGLSLVGLRYGLIVGLGTGLLAFVPVAGWALGFLIAMGLSLAQFGLMLGPLALVALVLMAGMALDTAFLSPRLVGEQVGLHPVWLIFALFAFSYLFGFVGTLIAVPLAAAAVILVRHAMTLYMRSDVYLGQSMPPVRLPIGTDPRGPA
jgi:predicted PurR-regulated permease PerM